MENSLSGSLKRSRTKRASSFQGISRHSRSLLKKAVRSKDREALDALIIDIEHSIQLAAGNFAEIICSPGYGTSSFGKYYTMAIETLSLAEEAYQKLGRNKNLT